MLAPSFYPVHGGAGLRFYRYLPYFHEKNIETTVVCGTPKTKKFTNDDRQADWLLASDGELVDDVVVNSARILKYKIPGASAKLRSKVLLEKILEICIKQEARPDIVHIIAPMPYQTIEQLKKIKSLGIKLLYSYTIAKNYSDNALIQLLQKWKVKQVLKQYDGIIVQSKVLSEIIRETNPKANISVIPNGVDTDKFSPVLNQEEKTFLRASLNLPADVTIIVLVGAIHPRKGTDLLIEAWSILVDKYPKLNLVLVGPRYDQVRKDLSNFKERMESLIAKSNHSSNVMFVGESDQVDLYLKASDIFVFPSEREGMPNAMIEAMSTGLPVIVTPFVGLSDEMGEDNKHFLLVNRTSNSLAESILNLLENKEAYKQFSCQARNWVMGNMQIAKSAEQHVQEFHRCIRP